MTDDRLTPPTGQLDISGRPARLDVPFGVEDWQFFAFVFAAATQLVFALMDQLPAWTPGCRATVLRSVVFLVLGYAALFNTRVKNCLIRILPVIKRGTAR
jgi:hypothetical protein